jgi:hypothetical protein
MKNITLTKKNFHTVIGKIYQSFLDGTSKGYKLVTLSNKIPQKEMSTREYILSGKAFLATENEKSISNKKELKEYLNTLSYQNQERVVYDNINDLIQDLHSLRDNA